MVFCEVTVLHPTLMYMNNSRGHWGMQVLDSAKFGGVFRLWACIGPPHLSGCWNGVGTEENGPSYASAARFHM